MVATLFRRSADNNVAEIMDAEDPFILYTSVLLKTKRNGTYHSGLYGHIPHIHLKKCI
jgi:hypothetical protein